MMTHRKFSVIALLLPTRQGKGLVEGKDFPGDWDPKEARSQSAGLTASPNRIRYTYAPFANKMPVVAHGGYQANRFL